MYLVQRGQQSPLNLSIQPRVKFGRDGACWQGSASPGWVKLLVNGGVGSCLDVSPVVFPPEWSLTGYMLLVAASQ